MTVLTTERLVLRPVSTEDFPVLEALWSQESYTSRIGFPPMTGEHIWMRFLRDIGHWTLFGFGNWSIIDRASGAYAGSVGLFDAHRNLSPLPDCLEVGWGLTPDFWGKGYATEAVTAMLWHADQALDQARTFCMITPTNLASIRLAERVGFTSAGLGLQNGETVALFERDRPA